MTQHLPDWANTLLQTLEIDPVTVDIALLKDIADAVNDEPDQARVLVGFIAGYAAGLAEGGGMTNFERAHAASVRFMHKSIIKE